MEKEGGTFVFSIVEWDQDIVSEMSLELKQLVINWISRLELKQVSAELSTIMMIAVLDTGVESITQVVERLNRVGAS